MRVLLRANVEFFSNWGMELLVTQLHDKNKAISLEALEILDEACEDKVSSAECGSEYSMLSRLEVWYYSHKLSFLNLTF